MVTGGGRGIGRAIAKKVRGGGRFGGGERAHRKRNRAGGAGDSGSGGKAASVAGDVAREADCEKIVRESRKAFGAIHILVNNAGLLGPVAPVEQVSARAWDEVIAVNLRGPFLLSRLVLPEMYARGSGSDSEHCEHRSQGGVSIEQRVRRVEGRADRTDAHAGRRMARKGVRVNALSPGPVPET